MPRMLGAISPRQADKSSDRQQRLVKFQIGESGPENPRCCLIRLPCTIRLINFVRMCVLLKHLRCTFIEHLLSVPHIFLWILYSWSHILKRICDTDVWIVDPYINTVSRYSSRPFKIYIDLSHRFLTGKLFGKPVLQEHKRT